MQKLITIAAAAGMMLALGNLSPAFAEHSAAHVKQQTADQQTAEQKIASGEWSVAEACNASSFYAQNNIDTCGAILEGQVSTSAGVSFEQWREDQLAAAAAGQYSIVGPAAAQYSASPSARSPSVTVIPETGGPNMTLLSLGGGLLLVGAGLVSLGYRRILR